mgnify:CR=1 FL=1
MKKISELVQPLVEMVSLRKLKIVKIVQKMFEHVEALAVMVF